MSFTIDSAPSLDTINQALQALYNTPDISGKEKASVWLGELQKSAYAWQVADQLLQQNLSLESCYFAAQTMRTKIQYAFHELPAESHQSLHDSLLGHASNIAPGTPPVIVTQLALALADLALQMTTWKSAVVDFIERFSKEHLGFLLELLTVLPEEINSRSLHLEANRRKEFKDELISVSPTVIQLLTFVNSAASGDDERAQRARCKTYKMMGSWFAMGAMPQQVLLSTQFMDYPFQALTDIHSPAFLHEAATDCICSALCCIEDLENYQELAERLFQGVVNLAPSYHQADNDEEVDKCLNYCRLFTELSESFCHMLLSTPNQGLGSFQLLDLLLMCVRNHFYEVGEITFNFWYRLSEDLSQRNNQELSAMFRPYVQNLILFLCQHCQMDEEQDGTPDELGDFGDYRIRVSELIRDVANIAGPSSCFVQMFEILKSTGSTSWRDSEAALFVMATVAKNILPEARETVMQVVEAILAMPDTTHIAIRYTSIQLVGELSKWIENNPHLLDFILQYLISGLQQPKLSSVAANSVQSICSQCRDHMTNHFQRLMHIVKSMETFRLPPDAAIGLLRGTATVLGRLPSNNITYALSELCAYQVAPLEKLLNEESDTVMQGAPSDPTLWLDRLAVVFRYTKPSVVHGQVHPCQAAIVEVWPVLSRVCEKYQSDVRIIERCCRCIRFAIRCLGKNSATLLRPLVTQMVGLYQTHQHSCFLYLGSILVDEYGTEPDCVPDLLDMLQAFCVPTFKMLEEHNGLRNHPDTVEDLFRLCLRFIQRAPMLYLTSPISRPIMSCAIAACSLDHKDTNASVMKFLVDLIKYAHKKQDELDLRLCRAMVKKLLQDHGQSLVVALINACLFCLPAFMSADVSEVLYELMLTDCSAFSLWLEHTLKALPTEGSGVAVTATNKQLEDFHKACTSAQDLKQVSNAVRELCQLYR